MLGIYKYIELKIIRRFLKLLTFFRIRRLDNKPIPDNFDEIRLFMSVRNEALRLPYFFKYYRNLGVDRFFVVDNNSTDESRDFLLKQKDTHIFYTTQKLSYQPIWFDILLHKYGLGRWCLIVDADEFIIYPYYERITLRDLCFFLKKSGYTVLRCFLMDMYPEAPLSKVHYKKNDDPISIAPYFDSEWNYYNDHYSGGMRRRVFGININLNKFPLIYFKPSMALSWGTHYIYGKEISISDIQGALLHFKYFSDFYRRTAEEVKRKKHWNEAIEYRSYMCVLKQNPNLKLYYDKSVKFVGSQQLIKFGIMKSSMELDNFIKNR